MPDRQLALEALSAIIGFQVKSVKEFQENNPGKEEPVPLHPQDIINILHKKTTLEDDILQISTQLKLTSISKAPTEAEAICKELFVNEEDFFDHVYDYDFTYVNDRAAEFRRGNEWYKRPCGWNRIALKVLNKYRDGNSWLGMGADAWPVSYHGTSIAGAKGIIQSYYRPGNGQYYGRGIYSTPDIDDAFVYSKTFTSKTTKKTYNVILQNRINPKNRQCFKNYWLVPIPDGTSLAKEREISENSIRPYGLLLREVKDNSKLNKFFDGFTLLLSWNINK